MTDALDFSASVMAASDSPDIRDWSVIAPITRVHLADREVYERGNVLVEFPGRDELPAAHGTQGAITYTLWGGCQREGTWYFAPWVECIGAYIPTGPLLAPRHVALNLLYYPMHPMLQRYQPAQGERIALVCTTGDTRRQNVQARAPGRTTVAIVPFAVGDYVCNDPPPPPPPPADLAEAVRRLQARVEALERRPLPSRLRVGGYIFDVEWP